MDDVRKMIYGVLAVFVLGILAWIAYIYISACGFTTSCRRAELIAPAERTAIPTLIPATLPAPQPGGIQVPFDRCQVAATGLIGAWIGANYPEQETFPFTDDHGTECKATFEDVQPLFTKEDLWFPGALACTACHGADVNTASAQLDLSSYGGIAAGSRREAADASGQDILGGGDWESSLLYNILVLRKFMAPGHPPDSPAGGPVIFAGTPVNAMGTPTPTP